MANPASDNPEQFTEETKNALIDAFKPMFRDMISQSFADTYADLQERNLELARREQEDARARASGQGVPVQSAAGQGAPAQADDYEVVQRKALATAYNAMRGCRGNMMPVRNAVAKAHGEEVAKRMFRSDDAGKLGLLITGDVSKEILEYKRDLEYYSKRVKYMRTPQIENSMFYPIQKEGAASGWYKEGQPVSRTSMSIGGRYLDLKNQGASMVASNQQLALYSAAESLIKTELGKALAYEDQSKFLWGSGEECEPSGMYTLMDDANKITRQKAGARSTVSEIYHDLGMMMVGLEEAHHDLGLDVAWTLTPRVLMAFNITTEASVQLLRREIAAGRLLGLPFDTTTHIKNNYEHAGDTDTSKVFLTKYGEVIRATSPEQAIRLEMSDNSIIEYEGNDYTAWDLQAQVIRATTQVDFELAYTDAVFCLEGVDCYQVPSTNQI